MAHNTVMDAPSEVGPASWRRADIQGLRAIAVLAVIAFHAGLPLPGGFTGVDIFFVISGFVITEMIFREKLATGKFRLSRFYVRRFRRLMPALAVLVSATVITAWFLYSTQSAQDLTAQTGLGAMFFTANVVVALTTGNYFDASAETNPLLHTWSLSVEEQFYFIFPAILLLIWSLRKIRSTRLIIFVTILIISILSFALAFYGSTQSTEFSDGASWLYGFYSPFTRIWEFGAGALIALAVPLLKPGKVVALLVGIAGLILGALSLSVISEQTPFPGPWTLLPVVAASLLIVSGLHSNLVSRSLSVRPMVHVGDWSYSLYLWHWPFIVFAIYIWPDNVWIPIIAALISFVPALISYYLVEQRLRDSGTTRSVRTWRVVLPTWAIPSLLAISLVLSGVFVWLPNPGRASSDALYPGEIGFASMESTLLEHRNPCGPFPLPALPGQTEERVTCIQSQADTGIQIALIGDSHALALYPGFVRAFPEDNIAWLDTKGVTDLTNPNLDEILAFVNSQPSIKVVILSAFWAMRGVDPEGLKAALDSIVASGKTPIITDDVPSFDFGPERCAISRDSALQPLCDQDREIFDEKRDIFAPVIIEATAKTPGAIFIRTSELFCDDLKCSMLRDGVIHFADSNHINFQGSDLLTAEIVTQGKIAQLLVK